jgi:hypothetical protein
MGHDGCVVELPVYELAGFREFILGDIVTTLSVREYFLTHSNRTLNVDTN